MISILTATGATIDHQIDAAVETPEADAGFFGADDRARDATSG